ncbi:glycosyltransferase family 2 protein [Leuconostoc lactis]|uniref:glycosyltransferase family 2 protein n=1 Tax=Leuconostoc lactis TaxID=1246 RepID=UPI0022E76976|nr:glycosyltransferase family 2 protein [Leuconostoc lactis]
MTPKVSVIITSIGRPELRAAIDSVKNQTYKNIEIIVVLDGSLPDGIDNQDVQVIYLDHVKNGNISRNIGITASRGEFIALLDDDDIFYPNKIQKQVEQVMKIEDVTKVVLYTNVKLFYSKSNVSKNLRVSQINRDEKVLDYLFQRNNTGFIQTSTLFAHRSIFLNNLFDETVPKHQDWDWLINVQNNLDVQFKLVDDILVEYRINSLGSSVGTQNKWRYSLTWFSKYEDDVSKYTKAKFKSTIIGSIMKDQGMERKDRISESLRLLSSIPFGYLQLWSKSMMRIVFYSLKY